jgi:hypothetical protein
VIPSGQAALSRCELERGLPSISDLSRAYDLAITAVQKAIADLKEQPGRSVPAAKTTSEASAMPIRKSEYRWTFEARARDSGAEMTLSNSLIVLPVNMI